MRSLDREGGRLILRPGPMSKPDYYELLGVTRTATEQEIKKAYKKVALACHPDRNPEDPEAEERFKLASEAYQVLSDPQKRQVYDRFGHAGLEGRGYEGIGDLGDIFSHFQDIFGEFFGAGLGGFGGGRRRRRDGPARGADVRTLITLTLSEAAFGVQKEITVAHPSPCTACLGTGAKDGQRQTCGTCGGRGQVAHARGAFVLTTTCGQCGGEGSIARERCEQCAGRGEEPTERKVRITVPAGVDEGQTLRLANQGQAGRMNGPPGHLYVTVQIQPDERFTRDGYDLVHEMRVTFPQAALGADVTVPTLEGEETIRIPAGLQPGDTLVVEECGIPRLDGRGRGDLVVIVQVDVPKKLSRRAKKLLEELEKTLAE